MSEGKRKQVKKAMYDHLYTIWRHEHWFADMAREGLHLTRWDIAKARFEKGPPRQMQYKIEVVTPGSNQAIVAVYREAGWESVAQLMEMQVFTAPEGVGLPPVNPNGEEQKRVLRKIDRRLVGQLLLFTGCYLWGLAVLIAFHWRYAFFVKGITEDALVTYGVMAVAATCALCQCLNHYRTFRMMRRYLEKGEPPPLKPRWHSVRFVARLNVKILLVVSLLFFSLPFVRGELRETHTLNEADNALPLVRLADIERTPKLIRKEGIRVNHVDGYNQLETNWSLLAPVQYVLTEMGSVPGEISDYEPTLTINYYQVSIPLMAGALVQDLIHSYSLIEGTDRQMPGLDRLHVIEEGYHKQVFAARGNRVVYLHYIGKQSAADLIPLLAGKWNDE